MYMYIAVSSVCITYLIIKGILNFLEFDKPILISIEGVAINTGERYDLTHSPPDSDMYEYYEMRYKLGYNEYCIVSEDLPSKDMISIHGTNRSSSPYVTKAQVVIDNNSVDVTEKLIQVAGPQCNFHESPIDFSWLFPNCNGSIHIIFNDTTSEIDIKTNTLVDGEATHIPLINYLSESEEDVCIE